MSAAGSPREGAPAGGRSAVVAHRGASSEAPENTLEAMQLAVELGADGIELDVRLGGDGTLAVIHDATVDRTTPATGPVAERSRGELARLSIPTLDEVFDRFPEVPMTVDVKDPDATPAVVGAIRRFRRMPRTVLYVEEGTGREAFRRYPGRRATSTRQALRLALLDRWLPGRPGDGFPDVVHTPIRRWGLPVVTRGFVEAAHGSGRTVQVWTVDRPKVLLRLAEWGVDAIITNDVRRAVGLLVHEGGR